MPIIRGAVQTLVAAGNHTTSSTSGTINLAKLAGGSADAVQFFLNVTESGTPTTLDVYLQHSPDSGTTWYDFGHFTQVGAVSTSIQSLTWARKNQADNTTAKAVTVTGDAALASGVVINGPIVDTYFRVKWVIAGTSYAFSVFCVFDRDA